MNLRSIPKLAPILAGLLLLSVANAVQLNLETASIADLHAAFADGSLSSEQLVRAYIARIDAYDKKGPTINTVITLNAKALKEAKIDYEGYKGPKEPKEYYKAYKDFPHLRHAVVELREAKKDIEREKKFDFGRAMKAIDVAISAPAADVKVDRNIDTGGVEVKTERK